MPRVLQAEAARAYLRLVRQLAVWRLFWALLYIRSRHAMVPTRAALDIAHIPSSRPRARPDPNYLAIQGERLVPALSLPSVARSNLSPLADVHRLRGLQCSAFSQ